MLRVPLACCAAPAPCRPPCWPAVIANCVQAARPSLQPPASLPRALPLVWSACLALQAASDQRTAPASHLQAPTCSHQRSRRHRRCRRRPRHRHHMLSAEQFAQGAQQLAAAWQRCAAPREPAWRWVPSQQPCTQGGGYLALQRPLQPPAAGSSASGDPPGSCGRASGEACGSSVSSPAQALDEQHEEEEPDAAAAPWGPSAAGAEQQQRGEQLDLACHIAFHPSYQVPVLYFEVCCRERRWLVQVHRDSSNRQGGRRGPACPTSHPPNCPPPRLRQQAAAARR